MNTVDTRTLAREQQQSPRSEKALWRVKLLVDGYVGISVLTLFAIVLLRDNSAVVTTPVWVRGTIVVASSLLTMVFTAQMARGSRGGYVRLRLVSAIMLVGIVGIIVFPGTFPVWMKIEQGVCGLLLLGVVRLVNGKRLRSTFAAK